jgi:signal peptidase II
MLKTVFRKARLCFLIGVWIVLLVWVDQETKTWAIYALDYHHAYPVGPGVDLYLTYNYGSAFSVIPHASDLTRLGLISLSILTVLFFLGFMYRHRRSRLAVGAGICVLAGGLGNLYDRLVLGYVIDFIDLNLYGWHWPVFNVADLCITLGIILLILEVWVRPAS